MTTAFLHQINFLQETEEATKFLDQVQQLDLVDEMAWEDNPELFIPSGLIIFEQDDETLNTDSVPEIVEYLFDGEDSRYEDN